MRIAADWSGTTLREALPALLPDLINHLSRSNACMPPSMISTILAWQPLVSMLPVATTTIARKGRQWAVLLVPMFAQVFAEAVARRRSMGVSSGPRSAITLQVWAARNLLRSPTFSVELQEAAMLKTFCIALVFVTAGGMLAARAQSDGVVTAGPNAEQNAPLLSQTVEQNAPGLSKPNELDAMGPWPLSQDYFNATGLLNQNYLTATGETVPCPRLDCPSQAQGRSVSQEPRPFDRKIRELDDRWERSICSNC